MEAVSASDTIAKRIAHELLCQPVAAELDRLGVRCELNYGDATANSALRVDLEGANAMGRLTWWSDGSVLLEVLRTRDGATIFNHNGTALDSGAALTAVRDLAARISGVAA